MTKLIRPLKISDQILSILEERIASGEYPEGNKIPPERALAEEFGVSRPSVRVALNVLIAKDLLEARQGDGYYVSIKQQQNFLHGWHDLLGKHTHWEHDVYDFSCQMEACMAALAAERRTEADLKRIEFWLEQFESACKDGHLDHQVEADASFHQAIADATHNILFGHLFGSVLKALYKETRGNIIYANQADDFKPVLMGHHRALFEAIKHQRVDETKAMAKSHVEYVFSSMQEDRAYQSRHEHADALAQSDLQRVRDW